MKTSTSAMTILIACLCWVAQVSAGEGVSAGGTWKAFNPTLEELKEARAVPHFKDGEFSGYALMIVRKGSRFEKLGLKVGDVIQTVDGQPLNEKEPILEAKGN